MMPAVACACPAAAFRFRCVQAFSQRVQDRVLGQMGVARVACAGQKKGRLVHVPHTPSHASSVLCGQFQGHPASSIEPIFKAAVLQAVGMSGKIAAAPTAGGVLDSQLSSSSVAIVGTGAFAQSLAALALRSGACYSRQVRCDPQRPPRLWHAGKLGCRRSASLASCGVICLS